MTKTFRKWGDSASLSKKHLINKTLIHIANYQSFLNNAKMEFNNRWTAGVAQGCVKEDFKIIKQIGRGAFGKVMVANYIPIEEMVAIKAVQKRDLVASGHIAHCKQEIKALNCVRFEFVIHLINFYMDNVYVYLVLPFIPGGEMYTHLLKKHKFEETLSKFYAAQVVLAFQYLHEVGLVYRDLKPENIMLCSDGYIKLADFGFCKKINGARTYTMLGTPQYLAPEIVLSQGYGYAADWWAFGILIYEMSAGSPPFLGPDATVMEKIPKRKYKFPNHFSPSLKDLVQKLTIFRPSERYGVLKNGANDIKLHEWFVDLDWDSILEKRIKPPYKPLTEGQSPWDYFDTTPALLRSAAENEFATEFTNFIF